MKWGINDTQHCTINDVWFLTHYCTTRIDNTTVVNICVNTEITHNVNDNLRTLAITMSTDITALARKTGNLANVGAGRYTDLKQYFKSNSTQRKAA